uniref:porin family protein n=1 Tax=Prevotella sp. TaxID=59823 RepID=UPI0040264BB5
MKHLLILFFFLALPWSLFAQIGEHRNTLSVGPTAGWNITNIKFTPKVEQKGLGGFSGGVALRYTVEKYFSTICSIQLELNYAQMGWKEDIKDINNSPVINATTGAAENYSRTINYIQVPFLAHLAWGKEKKGLNFFVNAGPQLGAYISESTKSNFNFDKRNTADRVSSVVAQDTMKVENKFDYGIAAGLGVEYTIPKVGHFLLEGRYYYGLGNIYGDSKRDYFASSNYQTISIKLSYLFDLKH